MKMRIGLIACFMLVTTTAACGSGGGAADKVASLSSPPPPSSQAGSGDSFQAYAKCMRDHGVDMPDAQSAPVGNGGTEPPGTGGTAGGPGAGSPGAFQAANAACSTLLGPGGPPPKPDAARLDKIRQQAKCMRDHGIDMKDPDPGTGLAGIPMAQPGVDSSKLAAAIKACGLDGNDGK
jgi:hypothetical protein